MVRIATLLCLVQYADRDISGHKHALIVHPHRYSHLRKFVWAGQNAQPPPLRFIHPMAPLELGPAELPGDLALESRDCVTLYQALVTAAGSKGDKSQFADLEPNTFFKSQATSFLRQKDVLAYEAALKERLQSLVRSKEQVERGLGNDVISTLAKGVVRATPESNPRTDFHLDKFEIGKELVSMLKVLDDQGDLVGSLQIPPFLVSYADSPNISLLSCSRSPETRWTTWPSSS